jgi:homoserine O-acetyltransferase
MVSVIGMVQSDAWTTLALEQWSLPIRLDPNWNHGNYYAGTPPLEGLTNSVMLITLQALYPDFINQALPGHSPIEEAPLSDINASHGVVSWLREAAARRAALMDANHILYLVRACQLFLAGHGGSLEKGLENIQAKSLFLPATNDLLLMPYMARLGHDTLARLGKSTRYAEIEGIQGHLDGVYQIQQKADLLKSFLEE